ncbi:MAG TPA: helix-turn-helix domain-containing protein [Euzebyales bacterium]|nr:helix-turn-helix domain-containing protein [Euzebyales bacterium]
MSARRRLDDLDCVVANGLEIFGDRWSLLILRDAFLGVRRFDEFRRDLGVARNVLTDRLERLTAARVLERRPYQEHPPRDEYVLTDKGRDLLDVLLALWRWGDRWEPVAEPRRLVHRTCGEETYAITTCAHCGERLTRRNLDVEPLPPVVTERRATHAGVATGTARDG